MSATPSFEHILAVGCEIGEAPIWVPEESRLYWVDTEGRRAFSWRPSDGEARSHALSMPATALLRRRGGGWVAVTKEGLAFWDQTSGAFEKIVDPAQLLTIPHRLTQHQPELQLVQLQSALLQLA